MSLKQFVRRQLRARVGYDLVRPQWLFEEALSYHLDRIFTLYAIQCVIDVGANRGQYGRRLRQQGYAGWILSFEPQQAVYADLVATCANDGKWLTFNYALGDEEGSSQFNVCHPDLMSSLHAPASKQVGHDMSDQAVVDVQTIRIRRLDTVLNELSARYSLHNPYLKADTQGHDLQVFKGAGAKLSEMVALQTELSHRALYEDQPTMEDVSVFLNAAGFDLSYYALVTQDAALRLIETDGVFVNRRLANEIQARRPATIWPWG